MENYNKWNKFVAELSDSDDEGEYPLVTKFDKEGGESIEIGREGFKIKETSTEVKAVEANKTSSSLAVVRKFANDETLNGYSCDKYYWSQDRYEVKLSVYILDDSIKSKDISIYYKQKLFRINSKVINYTIIEKELQYDLDLQDTTDMNDMNAFFDWEIKSIEAFNEKENMIEFKRVIELTFRKKSPIPGAFIWWSNVFVGDRKLDVSKFAGRKSETNDKNTEAWNEAHQMFLEKIASKEKIEVDF